MHLLSLFLDLMSLFPEYKVAAWISLCLRKTDRIKKVNIIGVSHLFKNDLYIDFSVDMNQQSFV